MPDDRPVCPQCGAGAPHCAESHWSDAMLDLETIRLIILLTREHYELRGRWPTALEVRSALRQPGL